jgi:soluble lytic murein transglycosylase
MGFGRLMRSVNREPASKILVYVPKLLATTACPRNWSAVAIRKLEALLPAEAAKSAIEKLYDHVDKCLEADDEAYEVTHLRQALLRHSWGDDKGALASIRKAVKAKDSSERSRVLYWAGRLEKDANKKNKIWEQLVEQYPLSFHALEVWREKQLDPFEVYYRRPPLGLERVASKKEEADEAVRWLEVLYIRGHVESAQKLARWIVRTYKSDLDESNILYISSLKSASGTSLNALTFFTRQVNENGAILNAQTLRMLFPRPYMEIFDKAATQTDTHLVLSVARQESGFDPQARSHANARGLLQLLPSTARLLSGRRNNDLFDEEVNAQLGTKFLGQLVDRFGGSVELALAGYNAGPGRINEWKERYPTDDRLLFIDLIPYRETRNYVTNIFRNNYWYERLYVDKGLDGVVEREPSSSKQRSDYVAKLVSDHRGFGEQMRGKALEAHFAQSLQTVSENRAQDASDEPAADANDADTVED